MSEPPASPSSLFFPSKSDLHPVAGETTIDLKSALLHDVEAIDYLGNIYIESAAFYKCNNGAQHEFLAFRIRDKLQPNRHNILLLDRVPRVEVSAQPDPTDTGSLDLTVEEVELRQPAQVTTRPSSSGIDFSGGKDRITSDAMFSGIITNSLPAADVLLIARQVDLTEICDWRHLSDYHKLEHINISHSDLGVEKLVVLAAAVSQHRPLYNLYKHQCYWYAGVVWEIICQLSGESPKVESSLRGRANFARFISIAPRSPLDDIKPMLELYNQQWEQFLVEIKPKTGKGIASMTKALKAIETERDQAQAKAARLEAEIAELRKAHAAPTEAASEAIV
ncbi:hypothetical protein RhiLY_06847 [Ceratobasidium sp. AG-Ba]|nr:hypothetical protein RhiLY_06847 [Ceratobasidium sp. AG-Ba]